MPVKLRQARESRVGSVADTLVGLLTGEWILEAINGLIQAAKAKARGYRTTRNVIAMAYLTAGDLDLRLSPT